MRLLVLLAIALACGCMGASIQSTTTTTQASGQAGAGGRPDPCWKMAGEDGYGAVGCYRDMASASGAGACAGLRPADALFYCQAAVSGDHVLCAGIVDQNMMASCYLGLAQDKGDTDICEQAFLAPELSLLRSKCLTGAAKAAGDGRVCDGIERQYSRDVCYKDVAESYGNPDACGLMSNGSLRDSCILNVAWSTHNSTLCWLLDVKFQRDLCISRSK